MSSEAQNEDEKWVPLVNLLHEEEKSLKEEVKAPQKMTYCKRKAPKNPYKEKIYDYDIDYDFLYDPNFAHRARKSDNHGDQEIAVKSEPNISDFAIGIPFEDTNYLPKEKEYSSIVNFGMNESSEDHDIENCIDPECIFEWCKCAWIWCIWICRNLISLIDSDFD